MFVGVDGCADGWIAVWYDASGYAGAGLYENIGALWADHGEAAELVLVDVPIGLRTASSEKRPCDDAARDLLSPTRHSSVFPVPIRAAVHADSYGMAKTVQEERTDGSLGVQSWNIADNIAELDTFLRETAPEAVGTVREAHPEVCFCALDGGSPAQYSKTGQPAAAFWEHRGLGRSKPSRQSHLSTPRDSRWRWCSAGPGRPTGVGPDTSKTGGVRNRPTRGLPADCRFRARQCRTAAGHRDRQNPGLDGTATTHRSPLTASVRGSPPPVGSSPCGVTGNR